MFSSQAVLCADLESAASLLPTFVVLVANSFSETMAGNVAVDNTRWPKTKNTAIFQDIFSQRQSFTTQLYYVP